MFHHFFLFLSIFFKVTIFDLFDLTRLVSFQFPKFKSNPKSNRFRLVRTETGNPIFDPFDRNFTFPLKKSYNLLLPSTGVMCIRIMMRIVVGIRWIVVCHRLVRIGIIRLCRPLRWIHRGLLRRIVRCRLWLDYFISDAMISFTHCVTNAMRFTTVRAATLPVYHSMIRVTYRLTQTMRRSIARIAACVASRQKGQ